MTSEQFIQTYKWEAIWNHIRYGIPASITLAQGIIESNSGNSDLAINANNFFGIKAYSNPDNLPIYYANDDLLHEPFRKYASPSDSFKDHSIFLLSNPRYLSAIAAGNYVDFAIQLRKDGYATSPTYASSLVNVINKYNLSQYDNIGNNKYLYLALLLIILSGIIFGSVKLYKKYKK